MINLIKLTLCGVLVFLIIGCGEKEETSQLSSEKEITKARMEDPEYLAKLKECEDEQQKLFSALAKAENELAIAKDADATSETTRVAQQKVDAARNAVAEARARAQEIVRARIHQDLKNEK